MRHCVANQACTAAAAQTHPLPGFAVGTEPAREHQPQLRVTGDIDLTTVDRLGERLATAMDQPHRTRARAHDNCHPRDEV